MVTLAFLGGIGKGISQGVKDQQRLGILRQESERRMQEAQAQAKRFEAITQQNQRRIEQADEQLEVSRQTSQARVLSTLLGELNDPKLKASALRGDPGAISTIQALTQTIGSLGQGQQKSQAPALGSRPTRIPSSPASPTQSSQSQPSQAAAPVQGPAPDPQPQAASAQPFSGPRSEALLALRFPEIGISEEMIDQEGRILAPNEEEADRIRDALDNAGIGARVILASDNQADESFRLNEIQSLLSNKDSEFRKALEERGFSFTGSGEAEEIPGDVDSLLGAAGLVFFESAKKGSGGQEGASAWFRKNILPKIANDPELRDQMFTKVVDKDTGIPSLVPNPFKFGNLGHFSTLNLILSTETSSISGEAGNFRNFDFLNDAEEIAATQREDVANSVRQDIRRLGVLPDPSGNLQPFMSGRTGEKISNSTQVAANIIMGSLSGVGPEGIDDVQAAKMKSFLRKFYFPRSHGKIQPIEDIIDQVDEEIDRATRRKSGDDSLQGIIKQEMEFAERMGIPFDK